MRNQSRFPWNQARKSAQPSSRTHFYNVLRNFWGKSRGNQREIRKSRTPKLLVADPSHMVQWQKKCVNGERPWEGIKHAEDKPKELQTRPCRKEGLKVMPTWQSML